MSQDVFPSVPGAPVLQGVALNPPPASILEAVTGEVTRAVATMPEGGRGALVGIATTRGVNLAVVSKQGEHVTVLGWIGKSWGAPVAGGAAVQVQW